MILQVQTCSIRFALLRGTGSIHLFNQQVFMKCPHVYDIREPKNTSCTSPSTLVSFYSAFRIQQMSFHLLKFKTPLPWLWHQPPPVPSHPSDPCYIMTTDALASGPQTWVSNGITWKVPYITDCPVLRTEKVGGSTKCPCSDVTCFSVNDWNIWQRKIHILEGLLISTDWYC